MIKKVFVISEVEDPETKKPTDERGCSCTCTGCHCKCSCDTDEAFHGAMKTDVYGEHASLDVKTWTSVSK